MEKIVVKGGQRLTGRVKVEGAKKCSLTNSSGIYFGF